MICGEVDRVVTERQKNPVDIWGVPTGFSDLDHMTGGQHYEQVTLVMGPPQVGKTTFILQIGLYAAMQGYGVAIYELEMDKMRVIMRLIQMLGGPSQREMMRGKMNGSTPAYYKALEILERLPIYISDSPVMTTTQLGADLANLQANHRVDMVILDYLNLLSDSDGKDDNEKAKLRSRRFRQVCRDRRVAGLSVQSINKTGMAADVPELRDMSGPAELQFDADNVLAISDDKVNPQVKNITPRKGRDLEHSGVIPLLKRGIRFENMAKDIKL